MLNGRTKQFGWLQAPATKPCVIIDGRVSSSILFGVHFEVGRPHERAPRPGKSKNFLTTIIVL